jgi:ribosomal protein L11
LKPTPITLADFFLNKQREKEKKEAESKMSCTLTQNVPVGESKTATALITLLGQYSVGLPEFHKRFDAATAHLQKGALVPIRVHKKLRAPEFSLIIRPFSIPFLLQLTFSETYPTTSNALLLFDAITLRSRLARISIQPTAKLFFSTLLSFPIKKITW